MVDFSNFRCFVVVGGGGGQWRDRITTGDSEPQSVGWQALWEGILWSDLGGGVILTGRKELQVFPAITHLAPPLLAQERAC